MEVSKCVGFESHWNQFSSTVIPRKLEVVCASTFNSNFRGILVYDFFAHENQHGLNHHQIIFESSIRCLHKITCYFKGNIITGVPISGHLLYWVFGDFIAGDLGGLSGVFIGFSLLCIAEMGYFLIRTIYLSIKNRHQNGAALNRMKNFRFYK